MSKHRAWVGEDGPEMSRPLAEACPAEVLARLGFETHPEPGEPENGTDAAHR